jgi:hypothetical protein
MERHMTSTELLEDCRRTRGRVVDLAVGEATTGRLAVLPRVGQARPQGTLPSANIARLVAGTAFCTPRADCTMVDVFYALYITAAPGSVPLLSVYGLDPDWFIERCGRSHHWIIGSPGVTLPRSTGCWASPTRTSVRLNGCWYVLSHPAFEVTLDRAATRHRTQRPER